MPDLKISQLPVATTPLAGTELVPIVQGGVTDRTTVAAFLSAGLPVSATTLSASGAVTLSGGTANGVLYLDGSKVATSGSALTFNGTYLGVVGDITVRTGVGYENSANNSTSVIKNSGSTGVGNLQFDIGGSEQMRLTSTGLGIGTSSPGYKFQVYGSAPDIVATHNGANITRGYLTADNGAVYFGTTYSSSGVPIIFAQGGVGSAGAERMRLDSSGNLGIGTSSPAVKLDVNGAAVVRGTFTPTDAITMGGNTSAPTADAFIFRPANNTLAFGTANTERARITSTGNVVAGGSVALATTATDGFLYVPTCAGTPTGTPTAITGMAPIVVDTTNNKMYFYSGGAWRDAGP